MKPILPNERPEGAEGVSTCPTTACPVFTTTDQLWVGLTVTPGGGIVPLETQGSLCAEHARKWKHRPNSCVVTKGGSPLPSPLPEQGPAGDWL